jgi:DNA polymerase-3 subunit delta
VQIRPADVDRFLARPDPAVRLVLVYGVDEGLVAERVATFVKAVTGKTDDPFAIVRLDQGTLAEDPGRLADEANEVPLFGGRRAIVVRLAGNASIAPALEALLAAPPLDAWVMLAGGDLRRTSPVRRLCETAKGAAAIACYADNGRDLDRVIDEETKAAGLRIAAEARAALKDLIGADRLASRSEVQKLCLYAAGTGEITLADVEATIGDASPFDVDEAIDALALGDAESFARAWRRLLATGTPGFVVAGAALRHFTFLHRARGAYDAGESAASLVSTAMPPIFQMRRGKVERAIELWPVQRSERALVAIDRAILDSRVRNAIADEIVGHALMMVATLVARRGQSPRAA